MASRSSRLNELQGISNGVNLVLRSLCAQQTARFNLNARVVSMNDLDYFKMSLENKLGDMATKSPQEQVQTVANKASVFVRQFNTILQSNVLNRVGFFAPKRNLHSMARFKLHHYQVRGLASTTTNSASQPIKEADSKTKKVSTPPNVPKFKQKVIFF
jgi:hypothetical protein